MKSRLNLSNNFHLVDAKFLPEREKAAKLMEEQPSSLIAIEEHTSK